MNLRKLALWLLIVGVITLVVGGVVGIATFDVKEFRDQVRVDIIGGDVDEGGCYISAGYSWCEAKQKCLRTWEEECE